MKKYIVVIEFECEELSTDELEEVADAMSIQYESLSDGDIAEKKAILTSVTYKEVTNT